MQTRSTNEVSPSITEAIGKCLHRLHQKHKHVQNDVSLHQKEEKTEVIMIYIYMLVSSNKSLLLTLHELMGSDSIQLASSEKAQQQRIRFVPKVLEH